MSHELLTALMEDRRENCHFCGAAHACYSRREDYSAPTSQYYPACETCARKHYPVPKQFEKKETPPREGLLF